MKGRCSERPHSGFYKYKGHNRSGDLWARKQTFPYAKGGSLLTPPPCMSGIRCSSKPTGVFLNRLFTFSFDHWQMSAKGQNSTQDTQLAQNYWSKNWRSPGRGRERGERHRSQLYRLSGNLTGVSAGQCGSVKTNHRFQTAGGTEHLYLIRFPTTIFLFLLPACIIGSWCYCSDNPIISENTRWDCRIGIMITDNQKVCVEGVGVPLEIFIEKLKFSSKKLPETDIFLVFQKRKCQRTG